MDTAENNTRTGGTAVMNKQKTVLQAIFYIILTALAIVFIAPIIIVAFNSFKNKLYIMSSPFELPNSNTFEGSNYLRGIVSSGFFGKDITSMLTGFSDVWENSVNALSPIGAFGRSLFITVFSVLLILLCASMCAWYINRSDSKFCRLFYNILVFSMVVPFQMVMYTMTSTVTNLSLNNPVGIIFVYLGFGAGLSVFMYSGFIKSVPFEIEEAAMIDGCNPIQTFFKIVFPILKPITVTVAILETMWIWNDYLLPYLVLGSRFKTIPVAVQLTMQGAYGSVDWGAFMAMLVLAIIPIIIFYLFGQKYIIDGVIAGAVKG